MTTALFVQRDAATVLVRRSLRATCTREEWDTPRFRQAAIDKAWAAGVQAMKAVGNYTFVTASPVTLYRGQDGTVLFADIRTSPTAPPHLIWPHGQKVVALPALMPSVVQNTTYRHWAEGPLPHIELMQAPTGLSDEDKRIIDSMPNSALRERARSALEASGNSVEARSAPPTTETIDFMIRGIFSIPDHTVLVSKQSDQGSKLVLPGGAVWDGRDNEQAPDSLLED